MRLAAVLVCFAACASAPKDPGLAPGASPDSGRAYLYARLSLVPEGHWRVVLLVQHEETGKRFMFPFKDEDELVLREVPPGRYLLHGYEFARGKRDAEARLTEPLRFDVPAGQACYLGDHYATSAVEKFDKYQKDEYARWRITLTITRIRDGAANAAREMLRVYPAFKDVETFTCPPIRGIKVDMPAQVEIGPGDRVAVLAGEEVRR